MINAEQEELRDLIDKGNGLLGREVLEEAASSNPRRIINEVKRYWQSTKLQMIRKKEVDDAV